MAVDSLQPVILLDSSVQPLEHPSANTGEEDRGSMLSPRQAKGWACNALGLGWVGKGVNDWNGNHLSSCSSQTPCMWLPTLPSSRAAVVSEHPASKWHGCKGLQNCLSWHGLVLVSVAHLRTTSSILGGPAGWRMLLIATRAAPCCLPWRGLVTGLGPVSWSWPFFGCLVQLLALPPAGGLVADNHLGPSPALGGDQLPGPRHSPTLRKALSNFSQAQQLINHPVV